MRDTRSAEVAAETSNATRSRRVVVGVGLDTRSAHALLRADEAARALSAELLVVHVVPARWTVRPLVWEADWSAAAPWMTTADRARRWCEAILARELSPRALVFAQGPVGAAMMDTIERTDADLAVLGAGSLARHVARRAVRPLLVARAPRRAPRILAFTDFSDPHFPVLRRAAELGRGRFAEITFAGTRERRGRRGQRELLLGGVAAEYQGVEVLLSDQVQTDRTLLAAAGLRGVDLVAVPSHPSSLRLRAGLDDLGCRVAASAPFSVLLVPVGQASADA